jgi:2-aminoadipate transaminase
LEPQISSLKALYEPRLDAMLEALDVHMADLATWRRPDGGFFIGLTLNADVHAAELLQRAREANLVLTDGRGFFASGGGDTFVRLPFCALTPEEIRAGVARLAEVVRSLA